MLTFPALVCGWALWLIRGSFREFAVVVVLTAVVFAVGLLLFAAGILGGGDGKLLAAVAAIAGPDLLGECLLWTLIFGVFVSVILLAARGALIPFVTRVARVVAELALYRHTSGLVPDEKGHTVAYGVIVAGGVIAALVARHAGLTLL